MEQPLELTLAGAGRQQALEQLERCGPLAARYGLSLTRAQMELLLDAREDALRDSGRVEFGGGVLPLLVEAFCDSPYLSQQDYAETLARLQEAFYYFKSESGERLDDAELAGMMKDFFNGPCQGSLEALEDATAEELWREARR